ncbi:MAG: ATP-binding cassette domain-containing protein, partial [bacterium]|nr:ATP-binding cassette domain-containing protein [bacterium]
TLLKMINRLIEPTSGSVLLHGVDVRTIEPSVLRRGMGFVLQNFGLFPHYTVEQNLAVVPTLMQWTSERTRTRAHELLTKLHMQPEEFLHRYPKELSGGQQQRVALCRALMSDPPILLMDEPFGALDPITRHDVRLEFKHLEEWRTKTIVLVTHDIEEAFMLADRVVLLDKGVVHQIGTPAQLLHTPATEFVQRFLAVAPGARAYVEARA